MCEPPRWPETELCHGHGDCMGGQTCICLAGWTASADLMNLQDTQADCNENVIAVQAIAGFDLICCIFVFIYTVSLVHAAARARKEQQRQVADFAS